MTAIAILRLQRAGFTEEQVEALAEFSEVGTATRSDITRLEAAISDLDHKIDATRADLENRLASLDSKIEAVRTDLDSKIAAVDGKVAALDVKVAALGVKVAALDAKLDRTRTDLELAIERVRRELEVKFAEGKAETIKWVVGVGFAQAAMILAVLRLFPSVHP